MTVKGQEPVFIETLRSIRSLFCSNEFIVRAIFCEVRLGGLLKGREERLINGREGLERGVKRRNRVSEREVRLG